VLDWKKREETKADVRKTINDILYDQLPEPTYSDTECGARSKKVYLHVYDSYQDAKVSVYV